MKKIYCEKLNSNDDSYTVELINVDSEFAVSDNDLIFERIALATPGGDAQTSA